jgi:hypothetical protein
MQEETADLAIERTPIRIGKDVTVARTPRIKREDGETPCNIAALTARESSIVFAAAHRKRVAEAAGEYIERSKQKSHNHCFFV